MKKVFGIVVLLIAQVHSFAQTADYKAAEKFNAPNLLKKTGTLEIIPFFINKTERFWFSFEEKDGSRNYYFVDPEKKVKRPLYDKKLIAQKLSVLRNEKIDTAVLNFMPSFSEDGKKVFLTYKNGKYEYDIEQYVLATSAAKVKTDSLYNQTVGSLSPDRKWVLFAKDHNLYLKKIGADTATTLSADAELYYSFGLNEFDTSSRNGPSSANWLSESKIFYVIRKDNRKVGTLSVVHTLSARPRIETYKYQLPGDKYVTQYELFIGDVESRKLMKINTAKWPDQELSFVAATANEIYFTRQKRTNDEIELCAVNTATGNVRVIISEVSKPYINNDLFNISIINNGKEIIWWSDRTGWGQYYLYDSVGKLKGAVTNGAYTAGKILFTDKTNRIIYYYGYGKEPQQNPYLAHLYKVSFDGGMQTLLTPENATHKIFFSPTGNYFMDNFSRIDVQPETVLRNYKGELIKEIAKPDLKDLYDYGWRMPEPFTVKAKDGVTDLYGIMWKPYNFDSTKKYPVISQVYPGPQIETVWPDFTVVEKYNNTSLAQVGFIVVVMGHRGGSPLRNKKYYSYGYGNLRDYALEDDKYGLEQLAQRFNFIDINRLGIFGHSGGAAMATAAICTYPDFYKVAVASSGDHDNNIYNRNYGEGYQGIKEIIDTATGKSSFKFKTDVNQSLAKNLKGHLLLVTGEVDANVHPGNTYRMVDALIKAGKDFDMLVLPGQSHHYEGIYQTFFENKLWHYFGKYLLEKN